MNKMQIVVKVIGSAVPRNNFLRFLLIYICYTQQDAEPKNKKNFMILQKCLF
jgi:hypothetical protein